LFAHIIYTCSNIQSDNSDTFENNYMYCPMYVIRLNTYLFDWYCFSTGR